MSFEDRCGRERWSLTALDSAGYGYQRYYLEKKYRGPETANQLWEKKDLASSSYDQGTVVTDHFEVVAKTSESIIVRCGDSPRVRDVRASDGLFEMTAEVFPEGQEVEFGLKSVFYNGLAHEQKDFDGKPPMGGFVLWLHQQYDKILMETAIKHCMR